VHNGLNDAQVAQLLKGVNINRVRKRTEPGRGTFSYLAQHDVRAMLIRIFGFGGFNISVVKTELMFETKSYAVDKKTGEVTDKELWSCGVLAVVRLAIPQAGFKDWGGCEYEDAAVGDAYNQPSRGGALDQATKSAVSDAIKRTAVNLGDQFGLSLYFDERDGTKGGRTAPVVGSVLIDKPETTPPDEQNPGVSEPAGEGVGDPAS
jgi:recombination DNA repair RAD52 pathway protein